MTFKPRRLLDVLDSDTAPADEGFWDRLSTVFVREADGHVRFRHPAVQEAAYASLPFKLRRQLHMTVGLRLEHDLGVESDADPAVLSQHFALAGDHARAHRYAMVAGRQATERFSHADAAQLYRRAIDAGRASGLADDSRALAEAWERLGQALRCMGEPETAAQALTEARRLLQRRPDRPGTDLPQPCEGRRTQHVADGRRSLAAARASISGRARRRRGARVPGADPFAPRRHPQPSGPMGGGDHDVSPGDRRSRGRSAS